MARTKDEITEVVRVVETSTGARDEVTITTHYMETGGLSGDDQWTATGRSLRLIDGTPVLPEGNVGAEKFVTQEGFGQRQVFRRA